MATRRVAHLTPGPLSSLFLCILFILYILYIL